MRWHPGREKSSSSYSTIRSGVRSPRQLYDAEELCSLARHSSTTTLLWLHTGSQLTRKRNLHPATCIVLIGGVRYTRVGRCEGAYHTMIGLVSVERSTAG